MICTCFMFFNFLFRMLNVQQLQISLYIYTLQEAANFCMQKFLTGLAGLVLFPIWFAVYQLLP